MNINTDMHITQFLVYIYTLMSITIPSSNTLSIYELIPNDEIRQFTGSIPSINIQQIETGPLICSSNDVI